MKKILIIGQAPPAVKQTIPYDTTMLYDWFEECGISKEQAQDLFDFDAVYNKFPGFSSSGGHKVPSVEQMDSYWPELSQKILKANNIIVLGNLAREYLEQTDAWDSRVHNVLYLMHPSKMNYKRYMDVKDSLIKKLKNFIEN